MILTKNNLILFVILTTSTTHAMKRHMDECHSVYINNWLTQSTIMVRACEQSSIENTLHVQYRDYEIGPYQWKPLSLIPHNNTSHLKIILPHYYKDPSHDISVTKNHEIICIAPYSSIKEEQVIVCNFPITHATIKQALINPAQYHLASKLALMKFEQNRQKDSDHIHKLLVNNRTPYNLHVCYAAWKFNLACPFWQFDTTFPRVDDLNKQIVSNSSSSLDIASQRGEALLSFLLPS